MTASQQLLKIFLTAEERELVQIEARKLVPGPTGVPTKLEPLIDAAFPLNRPEWDYNTYEGEEPLGLPSGSIGWSQSSHPR